MSVHLRTTFFVGRQKQRNQKNVCRIPLVSADKSKETKKMFAGFNFCRQTKPKKTRKCLPGSTYAGRHIQKSILRKHIIQEGAARCAQPLGLSGDQNSVSLSRLCSYSVCSLRLTFSRISWIFSVEVDMLVRDRSWFMKSIMVAIYLLISALA